MKNYQFHMSLHRRGLDHSKLAARAGITSRTHLTRVLGNYNGRGRETRVKLFPFLTRDEIHWLGWDAEYSRWMKLQPVEQSSMGNICQRFGQNPLIAGVSS
jgi:hypothetical protein